MTECWRQELRKNNIRVMLVNPSEDGVSDGLKMLGLGRVALPVREKATHVLTDPIAPPSHTVGPNCIPRRGLDAGVVNPPRFPVHMKRAIHHLEAALSSEGLATVTPGHIHHVRRVHMRVDNQSQFLSLSVTDSGGACIREI